MDAKRLGSLAGLSSFLLWGIFPVYFKLVANVPARGVLAHRIVWSFGFLLIYLLAVKGSFKHLLKGVNRRGLALLSVSAILIAVNWLVFIYAIASAQTIDASFGYFINPIFIIALGVIFLGERLHRWQLVSLFLAICAVIYQLIELGELPWISLVLALSFGLYGMIRKQVEVESVQGLFIETAILSPLAFGFLLWLIGTGESHFLHHGWVLDLYLVLAGLVTSIPLILFAVGVRRVSYSEIGFYQYLAPSLQFLTAILIFEEPLQAGKLWSFILVWIGLACLILGRPIEHLFRQILKASA